MTLTLLFCPIGRDAIRRWALCLLFGAVMVSLSACATLPASGPTIGQVVKDSHKSEGVLPFKLVLLDENAVLSSAAPAYPDIERMTALARRPGPERTDQIRPGDTLNISVFEIGIGLFNGATATPASRVPTAAAQNLTMQVREDGFIDLPYIGSVMAAGAYPEELAAAIRRRLVRLSENPQVNVNIIETVKSVAYLSGAVVRSGRYRLTAARERLLDVLALAGGSPIDPNELEVRLQRGEDEVTVPLNRISPGDTADLLILPGDRIQLVRVRPSYTVFGASDRTSQIYFEAKDLNLAEAIARASGPSDYRANPRGVFVCRYEIGPDGKLIPVVYQLNMLKTESYFLAQRFAMRDKDVILFATSSGAMTQKMVNLLSSLFSPVMAVKYATE